MESGSTWSWVPGFFHLSLSRLVHVTSYQDFIPPPCWCCSDVWTIYDLSIHECTDTWVVPQFGCCGWCCSIVCTCFRVDLCFQFSLTHTLGEWLGLWYLSVSSLGIPQLFPEQRPALQELRTPTRSWFTGCWNYHHLHHLYFKGNKGPVDVNQIKFWKAKVR